MMYDDMMYICQYSACDESMNDFTFISKDFSSHISVNINCIFYSEIYFRFAHSEIASSCKLE